MKKKIAIPTTHEGYLEQHFGHTSYFTFYEVEDNKIVRKSQILAPPHKPGLLPEWMVSHHITDVITSGMGNKALTLFQEKKIAVFTGVAQASSDQVMEQFLEHGLIQGSNGCTHGPGHTCNH
ncbi:NifB/NifX family molybdenum-iron cluster-binding protein [Prolixibacteraceae bacterium]|nr:NifB/NifX family molybdenum-iron cluster-binding protein [Prolixibacteraceae bacterium]